MPTPEKQVRVFISSTFRDMHAERDHLVTVVFPELRERVEQLGLEFFDVDLRWGVPAKDANGETANSWEYCRQWIDRVEPFFVCILGQRYGWVPEPQHFRDTTDRQRQEREPRSITDLEVRHAVLDTRRKRRSYFYLRATPVPEPNTEYVDPPEYQDRLTQLKTAVRQCGRPVHDYHPEWTGERFTGMEEFGRLVLDDLWSGVLRDERYVSKEVWRQVLGADADSDPRYTDETQPVPRELWEKIVALAKPPPKDPLDAEREQMEAFAATRLRWFQGRTKELEQLTGFINSTAPDAPRLAVVAAAPGQGKSALLAKLSTLIPQPSTLLVAHFVGATERSATSQALVERLLDELDRSGIEWPADEQKEVEEPKRDFNSLCERLRKRLGDYAGERRVVILLDALNQLTDGHNLVWLPHRLGPSVRVVVSCVEDVAGGPRSVVAESQTTTDARDRVPPEEKVLHALSSRQPALLHVPLGPLTEADVRTIAVEYLKEYCHELDREHLDTLCAIPQARNPLYLLVMLNELRTLGGNDLNVIVPARIASMSRDYPDTVALFRWVLQRLEVFGTEAVQWWCLYLAHGRVGMASHELTDLLARKLGLPAAATALLIERGLRRYLLRRGGQLDFFHGQLRQAVFQQYGSQTETANVHSDSATYFRDLADPEENQRWKGDSPRPFLELAFHLAGAQRLDELCQTLCDLRFVEARCRVSQVFELIADYRLAQENLPEAQADLREERAREERVRRWTTEIIDYARQWGERCDRLARGESVTEPEQELPEITPSVEPWSQERIEAECKRIIEHPNRLDLLRAFAGFVEAECYPLSDNGERTGFVVQQAANHAPGGPVNDAATRLISLLGVPLLLRRWPSTALYNPKPALLRIMEGHSSAVMNVSVAPDTRCAVSAGGGSARVWDLESGRCLRTFEANILGVAPHGWRAVAMGQDRTLQVLDLERCRCLRTLGGSNENVSTVTMTTDGRHAISGTDGLHGNETMLRVWNLETGQCVHAMKGHALCLSVTPERRRVVSGRFDHLQVWDLNCGTNVLTLESGGEFINTVTVAADGRLAVSGGSKGNSYNAAKLWVWDLVNGQCLRTLEGHSRQINSVSITPDGRLVISGSDDRTLRLWDLMSGRCMRVLKGHSHAVRSVSITPDGRRAVSGSDDRTVRLWDLESGQCIVPQGHDQDVWGLSATPDGHRIVSASLDGTLRIWNLDSVQSERTLEGHTRGVTSVSVTPDGLRAVSTSLDRTLRVWHLESGNCLRTLEGHGSVIWNVCVTPDSRCAVSVGLGQHRVWDIESGRCLFILQGRSGGEMRVSVTPDGRCAVVASLDRTLRLLDLTSGQWLRTLEGHDDGVISVSTMPDGWRAVSGSRDMTLRVWDLRTGRCVRVLQCNSRPITFLSVMPDGRHVVATSHDKLQVWDLESGQCVAIVSGTAAWFVGAYSPVSKRLSAGRREEVVVFDLANFVCGPAICTATNLQQARCPVCGQEFAPPPAIVAAIQSHSAIRNLESMVPSSCPHCQHPLQFNPFFAAADDYAEILRHGLEQSRRAKGADHEETLAHLAALAVHLEATGRREEAAGYKREHDRIRERMKDEL